MKTFKQRSMIAYHNSIASIILQQTTMENTIKTILAILGVFFFPIYTSLILVFGMVVVDTILACLADYKLGGKYDDHKTLVFFNKISVYLIAIIVTHSFSLYFNLDSEFGVKTLVSFISIKELVSADKHIQKLLGFSLFKFLITKLTDITKNNQK